MQSTIKRGDGRSPNQLRPVRVIYNIYEYAAGSVLLEIGKTKVLCAVSIQAGVPPFVRGSCCGWLKAEYALLPASTTVRSQRDNSQPSKDGRSVEISRLIGRSFRSIVDLTALGERTIIIDCDVLQADGGTRAASITGSFLALRMAQEKWLRSKIITKPIVQETIAAISVGVVDGEPFLDLNYQEDMSATADFNFVITQTDKIIEVQGGAERCALSWDMFEQIRAFARVGAQDLFTALEADNGRSEDTAFDETLKKKRSERVPLFSLMNRQAHSSKS